MRPGVAVAALLGMLAAGCSSAPDADPIAWWRQLEGGRLAEARPAPPNADAPYPNLGTVPARPTATATAVRARIASTLETDRRDAAYAASLPIVAPGQPRLAPPPPPAAGGIGASLAAASAGPAAVPSPTVMPALPAAPAAPAGAVATPAVPPPVIPAPPSPAAATPAPWANPPGGPPPAPRLPGVAAVTVPAPPRPAPPPPATPAAAIVPGAPVAIAFAPRAALLPEDAPAALRQLAGTRGGRDIWVVGYGESPATDPATQAASLELAFARARSMAAVLAQAGVPVPAIRLAAEAIGRGGVARIAE